MIKQAALRLEKIKDYADWRLLLFLVLFVNIKMPVKICAIVLMYLLQFNFKFGFRRNDSRLPLFYLLIIPIACAGLLANRSYEYPNYMFVFLTGIGFWMLSLLAIHQVKLMIERTETEKIHRTITAFFMLNAIVSLGNLALIVLATKSINPYTFKGLHQLYYIMTGDYIKGISFDISSTNAVLSALGVIYFLYKKMPVMLCVCTITLLLTYSNLINLILIVVVLGVFVVKSSRDQKSLIITSLMIILVFMAKISPQNMEYTTEVIKNAFHIKDPPVHYGIVPKLLITQWPDSLLNTEEKRQKTALLYLDSIRPFVAERTHKHNLALNKSVALTNKGRIYITPADPNTSEFQAANDTSADQKQLLDFIDMHRQNLPVSGQRVSGLALPGKITGIIQTLRFLYNHPQNMTTGLGIGNFSSKIAFRATGLGLRGQYPAKYAYIYPAFLSNHLDLYMNYFSKSVSLHSVSNNPFSVYDQLLSEYGLLGLLALILCYFGFFAKRYKKLSYGIPLLFFAAAILFIDYWFEQLSVMVLLELMLFLNIKETEELEKSIVIQGHCKDENLDQ